MAENAIEKPSEKPRKITLEEREKIYIKRVDNFLSQIQNWLPIELEASRHECKLKYGSRPRYTVDSLSIKDPNNGDIIATLLPQGYVVLLAQG
jgi:hypothetical protein